ncbi:FtsX-like permease family protein [bacterium]|nr:FtsX-like permease family protein [bacterium]
MRHRPYTVIGIFDAPDVAAVPAGIVSVKALRAGLERPGIALAKKFFQEGTAPDGSAPLERLEELAEKLIAQQEERFYLHEVVPERDDTESVHALAERLRAALPHVAVIEPEALAAQMEKAVGIFLAITAVVSVISSIVGGLLIVNTMAMAAVERRREVAIKVAVGASPAQIAGEFLLEAAVIGLAGSVIGVAAGIGATFALEPWILTRVEVGASMFKITPTLLASVVAFGVGLGIVAGLVPAVHASRADPAGGLREL